MNPATEDILARIALHGESDIEDALSEAVKSQRHWAAQPLSARSALLVSLGQVLRENRSRYAALIVSEMGKPIAEAEAEIDKCALGCDFYAENAAEFLAPEDAPSSASESRVEFEPLGVILAIMPWNYPFWQLFRFLAPALAAGNGAILKHASNVPQCALAIEEAVRLAGAPEGLFRALLVPAEKVQGLIEDDRISAVTLTGSTEVGRKVASQAGQALKKQVLELGGSDPFIVLADADIEQAAEAAVRARFQNAGQSCIAAKRFIVEETIADGFVTEFTARVRRLVIGDPASRATSIGPLATSTLRDQLHSQVADTVDQGGVLLIGGEKADGPGYFYQPTIIDHVTSTMSCFTDETFGPVASITRVKDAQSAVEAANDTVFGLGAAIWTKDVVLAQSLAKELNAGAVFINGMVASDPRLPFGGIRDSGYGRELSIYGIREFTNIKTIWIGPVVSPSNGASE